MYSVKDFTKDMYRLKELADMLGVSTNTLKDEADRGLLTLHQPRSWYYVTREEVIRYLDTLNLMVDAPKPVHDTLLYARVSSQSQKDSGDLDRQITDLVTQFPGQKIEVISDVGSGLNDKRRGLTKLINKVLTEDISTVAVTHKDRLTRFGFGYLEQMFNAMGTEIVVLSEEETASAQQELVDDMMGLIASFSGRFYGLRSAEKRRAREVIEELEDD